MLIIGYRCAFSNFFIKMFLKNSFFTLIVKGDIILVDQINFYNFTFNNVQTLF